MRAKTKKKHEMGKRFAIVICVAAAGVMALGAQTAVAATYNTKLTIKFDGGVFYGHVCSDSGGARYCGNAGGGEKCEAGRRVTLFKQRPGADRKLGADRGNWDGLWELLLPGGTLHRGDRVYARVKRRETDRYTCRTDRSETVTWPCTFVCGGIPPTTATTLPLARGVIRPQPLRNT